MMEEVFLHLSGTSSSMLAMVQALADFASFDGVCFLISYIFFYWFLVSFNKIEGSDV